MDIPEIKGLTQRRYKEVSEVYAKDYVKYLEIIDSLGGLMTYKQFKDIVKSFKTGKYSSLYIRNISLEIIKDMKRLKLIEIHTLVGNIKYFTLRNFAYTILYKENKTYSNVNPIKKSGDVAFKNSLLKVESYLQNSVLISNKNVNKLLLTVTNELFFFIEDNNVDISEEERRILLGILKDLSPDNYLEDISKFKDNNILKIIWIHLKTIFDNLKLKGNIGALKPKYLKFNNFNNLITIHFLSEIFILDTHDFIYYKRKINELYYKFNSIQYNTTRYLKNDYLGTGTLGFEGFNRIGAYVNIVSDDERDVADTVNTLNEKFNKTETTPIVEIEYSIVNLVNYYGASNRSETTLNELDKEFDKLINDKLNLLQN